MEPTPPFLPAVFGCGHTTSIPTQARHRVPETPIYSPALRSHQARNGPGLPSLPLPLPVTPWSPLSLQNLLLRHQRPSGGPVPAQHRCEGQPQLLFGPGKRGPQAALALLWGHGACREKQGHRSSAVAEPLSAPRVTTPRISLEWSPRGPAVPSTSPTSCTCPRPPTASPSPGGTMAR